VVEQFGAVDERYSPAMALKPVVDVSIEARTDDAREVRTRDELRELIASHDLSGLQWTDRVLVENWVVPHSHPVLTLNTRTTGDDLLSTYLHEQMHWWTSAQPGTDCAINATRETWPTVPPASTGGAKDESSTREHLLLCHLEHRAVAMLIGEDRADTVLQRQIEDVVYPWVYAQVQALGTKLDEICTNHDLWPARLSAVR
jgi:hypothetical protein